MFVSKARYERLERELREMYQGRELWYAKYHRLLGEWNSLVNLINAKGGRDFLEGTTSNSNQFSKKEIEKLLRLCHPDKHDNSSSSNEMTRKPLELREKMK